MSDRLTNFNIDNYASSIVRLDNHGQLGRARWLTIELIKTVKEDPSQLTLVNDDAMLGKALLLMLDQEVATDNNELQAMTELCYFFMSNAFETIKFLKPHYILDRLTVLYNGEDFLKETIKKALGLKIDPLRRTASPLVVKQQIDDGLARLRLSDLYNKYAVLGIDGFLLEQKEEFDRLISQGYFGERKSKDEIIKEGVELHKTVNSYIRKRVSEGKIFESES